MLCSSRSVPAMIFAPGWHNAVNGTIITKRNLRKIEMRIGQNPAKYVEDVAKPERVTVAVLNYIPFLSGFYAEALDVLKLCLSSARENANQIGRASCREECRS